MLGSALGPHPYPTMVREFQSVIGREAKEQIMEAEGKLPKTLIACVGGGSNSIGLFDAFRNDDVEMIGVEAGGNGIASGQTRGAFCRTRIGVLHGTFTYFLQDQDGQVRETHSISAGLGLSGGRSRTRGIFRYASARGIPLRRMTKHWTRFKKYRSWRALFRRWNPHTPSPKC